MSPRIIFLSLAFLAALASLGAEFSSPSVAQTAKPAISANANVEEDEWHGLPPGKGREETFYSCNPCHSLRLVTQQGLSKWRWDEAIDWMIDEQEMPEIEAAERELIVDYLAHFYGEDRKAKGKRKLR